MKIKKCFRRLEYFLMTPKQMRAESKRLSEKLSNETEHEKIMYYVDCLIDLLNVMIFKFRHEEEFIKYARSSTSDFIKKYQSDYDLEKD